MRSALLDADAIAAECEACAALVETEDPEYDILWDGENETFVVDLAETRRQWAAAIRARSGVVTEGEGRG